MDPGARFVKGTDCGPTRGVLGCPNPSPWEKSMAKKPKNPKPPPPLWGASKASLNYGKTRKADDTVNLKLRLPELLRSRLQSAAESHDRAMNTEIIERLERSFVGDALQQKDELTQQAETLLATLDPAIVNKIVSLVLGQYRLLDFSRYIAQRVARESVAREADERDQLREAEARREERNRQRERAAEGDQK